MIDHFDMMNGWFESIGGLMVLNNCRVLYKQKIVRGVSLISTAVFMSWGFYNPFYYAHLHQWLSFSGGMIIVSGNLLWLYLALYYKKLENTTKGINYDELGV